MPNVDPKKQAEIDQAIMQFGEVLPALYWKLYQGCLQEGFSQDQAFRILLAYIVKPFEG